MLYQALAIGAFVIAIMALATGWLAGEGIAKIYDIVDNHDERLRSLEGEPPSPNPLPGGEGNL